MFDDDYPFADGKFPRREECLASAKGNAVEWPPEGSVIQSRDPEAFKLKGDGGMPEEMYKEECEKGFGGAIAYNKALRGSPLTGGEIILQDREVARKREEERKGEKPADSYWAEVRAMRETKKISVPSSTGHDLNVWVTHRKGTPKGAAGLIFLHGGGGVKGTASGEETLDIQMEWIRLVEEKGVQLVMFGLDYDMGPDRPLPAGYDSTYSATCWLIEHAKEFGCDPKRFGMFGESGGALIACGAGNVFAKNGKGDLIKVNLMYSVGPSLDTYGLPRQEMRSICEHRTYNVQRWFLNALAGHGGKECWDTDPGQFKGDTNLDPTCTPDEIVAKCPPAVVVTGEYDIYRRTSENMASKYLKNGVLADFACYPARRHCYQDAMVKDDFARVFAKFLA